jgi:hypothetical protein
LKRFRERVASTSEVQLFNIGCPLSHVVIPTDKPDAAVIFGIELLSRLQAFDTYTRHRLRIDGWRYSGDLRFKFGYAGVRGFEGVACIVSVVKCMTP